MKKLTEERLENIYAYLFNKERYKATIQLLIEKKEYDLAIIVLWKIFMFFVYERLAEIDKSYLTKKWKEKFKTELEKEVNLDNFYWPNQQKDNEIIIFLGQIYPIDRNILKTLIGMLDIRNISAHVSATSMTEDNMSSYLSNLITNIKIIEMAHLGDSSLHLKRLVTKLNTSQSIQESSTILEEIVKLKNSILPVHLKEILISFLRNNHVYDADKQGEVLDIIYESTKDNNKIWTRFSALVDQNLGKNYYIKLKNKISIDDLPF